MGHKKDQSRLKTAKCRYNDRGFCKHGDKCFNIHTDKVCNDENCSETCDKRHPNPCKFGPRCDFNRKNVCAYSHDTFAKDNKKINDINEKFTKKFSVIEKQMTDIQKKTNKDPPDVKNLEKKLEAFEKNIEEKCYTFEKKIIHLNKINNDKDLRISELENKLKEIQTRVSEITKNDEKVKEKKKKKCFGCDQCDFEAASEAGLRTHQARIHSKSSNSQENLCNL